MSTTTPAIKAILMLVTTVVVIGIFTGLSNPVVQVLLGFADEATLDDGTKEKYSYLKDINEENIELLVKGARSRWKIENECFNTLKNQGYCMEHNYGHDDGELSMNFYIMILLSSVFLIPRLSWN